MVKTGKLEEVQAREVSLSDPYKSRANLTYVVEKRVVTQYTLFVQEQLWAPYVGRPVTWPESTCPLPTVDEQLDSMVWTPDFVPGRIVHQNIKPQPCNISSAFVETVKLMEIASRIMKTLWVSFVRQDCLKLTQMYRYGLKADVATLASSGVISEIR